VVNSGLKTCQSKGVNKVLRECLPSTKRIPYFLTGAHYTVRYNVSLVACGAGIVFLRAT
jgi:hypothetical protein